MKIIGGVIKQANQLVLLLINIIFPKECLGCQKDGQWLCADCFNGISLTYCQQCPICHDLNYWGEYCDDCYQSLDGVMVASNYELKLIKDMIKTFKYRFVRELSEPLANLLIVFLGQFLDNSGQLARNRVLPKVLDYFDYNLIMPVPLHKKRLAWRGFNQSELLVKLIASYFNLEVNYQLKRFKNNKPQVGLNKKQRRKNIRGCFVWQGQNLENKNIILVDDVFTSGSTLQECAKVLKQHGAGEVWGLVIAKN